MGCNPDILENIVQRAGGPRDIYFPIYPDYNPCTNIIQRRKIVHKTDILTNISVLCYNISEYQGQRTLVFYFYPMYNGKYMSLGPPALWTIFSNISGLQPMYYINKINSINKMY